MDANAGSFDYASSFELASLRMTSWGENERGTARSLVVCFFRMRRPTLTQLPALGALLIVTACATIGPPQPPSLELPKPPSDLRAARKGDRVVLTWTVPGVTTDRQRVRGVGETQICRGLEPALAQCGTPVGVAAAQPSSGGPQSSKQKVAGSYTDSLSGQLQRDDPSSFVTYAIEVLNAGGRGAGLSNQVRVPLVRTLPPPRDFAATVTGQGVVLRWTNDIRSVNIRSVNPESSIPLSLSNLSQTGRQSTADCGGGCRRGRSARA